MSQVQPVLTYIYQHYPNPFSLGISRLMKLLFIADWQSSNKRQTRLLPVEWTNTYSGPFSKEVVDAICNDSAHFEVEFNGPREESIREMNFIISPKKIKFNTDSALTEDTRMLLDEIISETAGANLEVLNKKVWKLFPFLNYPKPSRIHMPSAKNRAANIATRTDNVPETSASESNTTHQSVALALKTIRARNHSGRRHHIFPSGSIGSK